MTDPASALAGRREGALLELPSVARMAAVLAERCREPSWVRTLVAGLDRFRGLTGHDDLEALLAAARSDPAVADRSLLALARALDGQPDAAVAGLAMGAKVWFRLNGVPVAWRPLPAATSARRLPEAGLADPAERLLVLAPIGSGLHLAELLRSRVGDLGSLDAAGGCWPSPRPSRWPSATSSDAAARPSASPSCPSRPGRRSWSTWSGAGWPGWTPGRGRRWSPAPTDGRSAGPRSPGPGGGATPSSAPAATSTSTCAARPVSSSASGASPGPVTPTPEGGERP